MPRYEIQARNLAPAVSPWRRSLCDGFHDGTWLGVAREFQLMLEANPYADRLQYRVVQVDA